MITGIINEEWRSVSGYANYQVSNIRRARHVGNERIMKSSIRKDGYYQIGLYSDGSQKNLLIHRLVAQACIENPDDRNLLDKINHKKTNNIILNLRWVSIRQWYEHG